MLVLSGRDGRVLHRFDHTTQPGISANFARVGGPGDVDGDGLADLAYSANPTTIMVVSGATGAALHVLPSENAVLACPGDLDGDGRGDIVTALTIQGVKSFVAWSGADAGVLWEIAYDPTCFLPGFAPCFTSPSGLYGQDPDKVGNIRVAGDQDGDGVTDLMFLDNIQGFNNHRVLVSGVSGVEITRLRGLDGTLEPIGDLDADGRGDFVLSGKLTQGEWGVHVIRGFHGTLMQSLWTVHPAPTAIGTGDVDRDGVPDVLAIRNLQVGPGPQQTPVARVYSGRTGRILHQFGPDPFTTAGHPLTLDSWGRRLAPLGDVTGDGVPEVIVGMYGLPRAFVYSFPPSPVTSLPNSMQVGSWPVTVITAEGPLTAHSELHLTFRNGQPFGTAWFALQAGVLPAPQFGMPCTPDLVMPVPLDGTGAADLMDRWPGHLPADVEFNLQAIEVIPGVQPLAGHRSNMLRLTPP